MELKTLKDIDLGYRCYKCQGEDDKRCNCTYRKDDIRQEAIKWMRDMYNEELHKHDENIKYWNKEKPSRANGLKGISVTNAKKRIKDFMAFFNVDEEEFEVN